MKTLILIKLHCTKTEDHGTDECTLKLFNGDSEKKKWKQDFDNGNTFEIDYSLSFEDEDSLSLKLYDRDWPDSDDFLGKVVICKEVGTNKTGTFDKDGAKYELYYSITEQSK